MQTAADITSALFGRTSHGIKFGLERMVAAAAELGNPQTAYHSIHIAGTNGKGSTSAFIDSVVRENGFKTGLFTSPHIVNFEERFIINGKPIRSPRWMEVYRDLAPIIEKRGLTFFEAVTLIAYELFKREKVEWGVFETGMGGRLDSTNIITPEAAAITTIAMGQHELFRKRPYYDCGGKTGHCQAWGPACHGLAAAAGNRRMRKSKMQ